MAAQAAAQKTPPEEPLSPQEAEQRLRRSEFFLQELDANHNGVIEAEEVAGRKKIFADRLLERAGLKPEYPADVAKVREGLQRYYQALGARGGTAATPPEKPVPPKDDEEARIRSYAKSLLALYDKNKNGTLEKDEWSEMRGDVKAADRNADAIITLEELTAWLTQLSRARRGSQSEGGGPAAPGGPPAPAAVAPAEPDKPIQVELPANYKRFVFQLKRACAADVAKAVRELTAAEKPAAGEKSAAKAPPPGPPEAGPARKEPTGEGKPASPAPKPAAHVTVAVAPVGNSLIVQAPENAVDEIRQLLAQLDRRPQQVAVDVIIAVAKRKEAPEKPDANKDETKDEKPEAKNTPGDGAKGTRLPDLPSNSAFRQITLDLQPPAGAVPHADAKQVLEHIRDLEKSGRLQALYCPKIVAVENQLGVVRAGRQEPRITESTFSGKKVTTEYLGLDLKATPRITPEGLIVLALEVEWKELGPEEEGVVISKSAAGEVVRARPLETFSGQTTVTARTGQTVVLGDVSAQSRQYGKEILVLVTPRIIGTPPEVPEKTPERSQAEVPSAENATLPGNYSKFVFPFQNALAADVAKALRELNTPAPSAAGVTVAAAPADNCLIVQAPDSAGEEIKRLLAKLDRRPQKVAVEVIIAVAKLREADEDPDAKKDEKPSANKDDKASATTTAGNSLPGLSERSAFRRIPLDLQPRADASGQSDAKEVVEQVRDLEKAGRLEVLLCRQVIAVENQPGVVRVARQEPRITGGISGTRIIDNWVTMEHLGLILKATPQITPDGLIVISLDVQWSELRPEAEGVVVSTSATGEVVRVRRLETFGGQTTVTARTGQTVVLGDVSAQARQYGKEILVVVTPRIIDTQPQVSETTPEGSEAEVPSEETVTLPGKCKRFVFPLKHAPAADVAKALRELNTAGEPPADVRAVAAPAGNCLIVQAPENAVKEIKQLLSELDRQPQNVSIEVVIAAVKPHEAGDEPDAKQDVVERMRALEKSGRLKVLYSPQLVALENQAGCVYLSRREPVITGGSWVATGRRSSVVIQYMGLLLGATPRITAEGLIVLPLDVEFSQLGPEEEGVPVAFLPDGEVVRRPRSEYFAGDATVTARDGQTVALGVASKLKPSRTEILVVVTPRIIRTPPQVSEKTP